MEYEITLMCGLLFVAVAFCGICATSGYIDHYVYWGNFDRQCYDQCIEVPNPWCVTPEPPKPFEWENNIIKKNSAGKCLGG
jgi:hypothetical protein